MRAFAPERFADDIFALEFQGLGRGKGFRVSRRLSILHGTEFREIRQKIASRIVVLLKKLIEAGAISEEDILAELSLDEHEEHEDQEERRAEDAWAEEQIVGQVDDLLRVAGISPARFSSLERKLAALRDELLALQALQE